MFERHAARRAKVALTDTPAVLIHGPRQVGKSTLAEEITAQMGRSHATLDDPISLGLAARDPAAFFQTYPAPVTIDEVQRAPELFLPMKLAIDRDRLPGNFLLTGSANVLALPRLADSLAGRMDVIDLLPLSQGEIESCADGFVDAAFGEGEILTDPKREPESEFFERLLRGGFPEAVQRSERRRRDWYESYLRTILDRDVKDLAGMEALTQVPRILTLLASRVGSTLNVNSFSSDMGIPYSTLRRYVTLLETIFLVRTISPWSTNQGKTITKAPKLFLTDTGLLCHMSQIESKTLARDRNRLGPVIENFVAMELAKQCSYGEVRPRLMHLRTVRHLEVDFVLESRAREVVGIEVKAAQTVNPRDAEGLRYLRELAGDQFKMGIVLYCGEERVPLDDRIVALPISCLWRSAAPSIV